MADDRPYGRRSARARWQPEQDDSTGTWSRYEEPGEQSDAPTSGWTPAAPTSGWTPATPTSGWTPGASTSEWTREAYTGEWSREEPSGEWSSRGAHTGEWKRPASWEDTGRDDTRGGRRRREAEPSTGRRALPDWRELPAPADDPPPPQEPAEPRRRDRFTDTSEWVAPRDEQATEERSERSAGRPDWAVGRDPAPSARRRRSWQDQIEPRWPNGRGEESTARLSDDDPRWVGIPSSAPRSPAVAYPDDPPERDEPEDFRERRSASSFRTDPGRYRSPEPRYPEEPRYGEEPRPAARPRYREETSSRTAATGWQRPVAPSSRQRPASAPSIRRRPSAEEMDDDFAERTPGGVLAAVLATLGWYAVPLVLFVVYTLFQSDNSLALGSLSGSATRFAAALAISLIVAVLLRWVSTSWRSVSVGLAAAVVGGGLSTVLLSAISGQPIG
ncbi:hypothetical protein [Phytohabitans rumicis]|nr:hypothetical protein [Phytohabitans rumicis]